MRLALLVFALFFSVQSFAQTRIKTNVLNLRYATAKDKTRNAAAFKHIESIVNNESFRSKILNLTYTQTTTTPEEILASILKAEENFSGGTRGVIDMFLEMYYEEEGAIGFTYANDPYVYLNRWVQSSYTPMETAGNLFHEWLHKLGHTHSFEWTEDRKDSVPYKLGYLLRDMAVEEASKGDPLMKEMMSKSFDSRGLEECSHY